MHAESTREDDLPAGGHLVARPPRTPTSPRPRTPSTPACTSSRAPRAHGYDVARSSAAHVLDPTDARAFHAGRIFAARFPRPLPRHQVLG